MLERNSALNAVMELKAASRVRFSGVSGTLPHLQDHIPMGVFDVFQIPYTVMEREHETIIAEASAAGSGIIIRGGAAKGTPLRASSPGCSWRQAKSDDLLVEMTPMEFILRFKALVRLAAQVLEFSLTMSNRSIPNPIPTHGSRIPHSWSSG